MLKEKYVAFHLSVLSLVFLNFYGMNLLSLSTCLQSSGPGEGGEPPGEVWAEALVLPGGVGLLPSSSDTSGSEPSAHPAAQPGPSLWATETRSEFTNR